MEKIHNIHNMASKVIDDVCKKKNKIQKNLTKDTSKINIDHIADLPYKCCTYCQKVFINSKFLMKHLLRRHSDELVLFYKNRTDHEFRNTSDDLQHLITILKEEFSQLKKELISAKLAVNGKKEIENQSIEGEENVHAVETQQGISVDIVSDEIRDLKGKIVDVEQDIQNLNDKFIELDNVLKKDILMKDDVSEKLALSEEKIMQAQESQFIELRQILLNELKSLLDNQQLEMNNEWKSQMFELRHEIKRLDIAIDYVKQQLKCTDSLKEEIKKELIPQIVPHISSSKSCKKKHSLFNPELSVNKFHQTLQQQEASSHENFDPNASNSKSFGGVIFQTDDEIASLVADKLSQFSIEPNTSKISCSEFNKKMKLLNFEKERYCKKFANFNEIYNELNMLADQKAHSKLKTKKHNKISFAEPLTTSRSNFKQSNMEDDMSKYKKSNSFCHKNKQFASSKKHIPSDSNYVSSKEAKKNKFFTFSDEGACGDASLSVSDKQNNPIKLTKLSSIREHQISDTFENIEMPRDLSIKLSKDSLTVSKKQSKNKSPVEQRQSDFVLKNSSNQCNESFEFSDEGDCSNSIPFSNRQNRHIKHIKSSMVKNFQTSSPIENVKDLKKFKVTVSKPSVLTTENSKLKSQQNYRSAAEHTKLNSVVNNHIVPFKGDSVYKTIDKCSDLKNYHISDDDFDDVSSLETYKSSDDDDHIITLS